MIKTAIILTLIHLIFIVTIASCNLLQNFPTGQSTLAHDPIEDDPRYENVFDKIDSEVDEQLKDHPMKDRIGFVHFYWNTKKEILKKKYGIEWKSPKEMNPHIIFD